LLFYIQFPDEVFTLLVNFIKLLDDVFTIKHKASYLFKMLVLNISQ
jgi:hypothetical protein